MAERYYGATTGISAPQLGPPYERKYGFYPEDQAPRSRPSGYVTLPNEHRRALSHNPQASLPIERSNHLEIPERNREFYGGILSYTASLDLRARDQPSRLAEHRPSPPSPRYEDNPLLYLSKHQKLDLIPVPQFDLNHRFKSHLRLWGEAEVTNPKLCGSSPMERTLPRSGNAIAHVGEYERAKRDAAKACFLRFDENRSTQSTSTEAVVDERGFQPSQSYFKVPRRAAPAILPQRNTEARFASGEFSRRPRLPSPACSNTSTETVIADNRLRRAVELDKTPPNEGESGIQQEDMMRFGQLEAMRVQQQEANRVHQEKKDRVQHDKDFSAFLREEFQKVPERMENAGTKWPGLEYGQAIGKAFLSESSLTNTNTASSWTSDEDVDRTRRGARNRRRSKSTAGHDMKTEVPQTNESRWAYSGLPINRFLRNPSGAFPDKTAKKPISAKKAAERNTSENIARIRDMMEYKARDDRGPRPPSPDWMAEYIRAGFEPPRAALHEYKSRT